MRQVRKHPQEWYREQPVYGYRDRSFFPREYTRYDYGYPRMPSMLPAMPRIYPRRDLPQPRVERPMPAPRRDPPFNRQTRQPGPIKKTHIARRKPEAKSKSKEDLDAELDQYMGDEAVKSRLDEELDKYAAEEEETKQ